MFIESTATVEADVFILAGTWASYTVHRRPAADAYMENYTDWVIKYAKQLRIFFIKSPTQHGFQLGPPIARDSIAMYRRAKVKYQFIRIIKYSLAFDRQEKRQKKKRFFLFHFHFQIYTFRLRLIATSIREKAQGNLGKEIELKYNFVKITWATVLRRTAVREVVRKKENYGMSWKQRRCTAFASYIFMKLSSVVRPNRAKKFNQNTRCRGHRSSTFDDGWTQTEIRMQSIRSRSVFASSVQLGADSLRRAMKWFSESRSTLYLHVFFYVFGATKMKGIKIKIKFNGRTV